MSAVGLRFAVPVHTRRRNDLRAVVPWWVGAAFLPGLAVKFATPQSEARTARPGLTFFQRLSHQPARFLHPRRSLFPFGACALRDSASTQVHLPSGGRWAHPWPKKIASPFTAKSLFSSVSATASWSCWSQRSAAAGAAERCAAGPRAAALCPRPVPRLFPPAQRALPLLPCPA